ncbi:MAG: FAD-dependent oxidoreductase [Pseudomonadota bacterium]
MKSHAEIVIIGGGVMGVSLAYHLTKLGKTDVVLLEKNELTAGSTWHAAGLCTHFAHNATIQFLRAHSVDLYKNVLPKETGMPVSFHACGAMRITRSAERMAEFRHVKGLGKFTGYDFTVFDADELYDFHPLAEKGDGLIGGIYEPLDGHVDPSQATHAMAAAAKSRGAQIVRNNPVEKIERTAQNHWRLVTRQGVIEANTIVNAAGTWCREIGDMMGVDLPVVPMLHQYLVTEGIDAVRDLDRELPIIRDPEESWYVRQERDGLILGPYETQGTPWSVDAVPPEFGMELLPPEMDRIEHIVEKAMARIPALADGGIKSVVNGPITFTPDANPLIGPAYGLPNAWLLTGSSMGVMEGGGAGCFLAQWMVDGEPPMDELAVDPRRFGDYADRNYRVTKAVETFGKQFGVHFPFEERDAGRPARTSALHQRMLDAGAVMGCAYGWERPNYFYTCERDREQSYSFGRANWFDAVANECRHVSESVALADLSPFSKFDVTGPDSVSFVDSLGANSAPKKDGQIGLTHFLTKSGGVYAEFTVTRFSDSHFYLTSAAAAERRDETLLRDHANRFDVEITNCTQAIGIIGVMGPKAPSLLQPLTDSDLSIAQFPWLCAQKLTIARCEIRALRVSYIGESGWELHANMEKLGEIFDALQIAGAEFNLGYYGAFAANAMRLEKGYRAWGMDFTTERSPLEAGAGRFVKSEPDSFVKKGWEMVLLALDTDAINADAFGGHPVFAESRCVGVVTSGAYGARVQQSLALAYLREPFDSLTEPLCVEITGQRVAANVLKLAPYDPENTRMKS